MGITKSSLSVIIQCYNQADFLVEAIQSVLSQTRLPSEIIIIDDCSSDATIQVVSLYLPHPLIRFIRNEVNLGPNQTAEKALNSIQSEYFFILPADDKVFPEAFEHLMNELELNPNSPFCCSHPAFYTAEKGLDLHEDWVKISKTPITFNPSEAVEVIKNEKFWIAGHTTIFKLSALRSCGGFLTAMKWHSDWFVLHVMAFRYGFSYIPLPLCALFVEQKEPSYSKGALNRELQSEVLYSMVSLLKTSAYSDVKDSFLNSRVFDVFNEYEPLMRCELVGWPKWPRELKQIETNNELIALKEKVFNLQSEVKYLWMEIDLLKKDSLRARVKKHLPALIPIYRRLKGSERKNSHSQLSNQEN